MFKDFFRDESGAVTVDYVVFLGGVATMALTIVGDIAQATMSLTDRINERTSYESIVAEIEQSYSPAKSREIADNNDGAQAGSDDGDGSGENPGGSGSDGEGYGNPGNDKNVGKAGENPNGKGGWGNGSKGKSQ